MPKTAVQTPVCDICGAAVRKGSQFCYNCGGSLDRASGKKNEVVAQEPLEPVKSNGSGTAKPAERSAPRRRRKVERGPVEIVWEPREGISAPFVIASTVLLVFAFILFVLAMWLK